MMKNVRLLLMLGAVVAFVSFTSCNRSGAAEGMQNMRTVMGNGSGAQAVPVATGTGTSTFTGTYNPNNNTLTYTINYTGLSGMPTSGGIFAAAPGLNGGAIGSPFTFSGTTGTGSVSGSTVITSAQESDLLAGRFYYNLSTMTKPLGEVRGQISVQ
jgi:hypothetical protein